MSLWSARRRFAAVVTLLVTLLVGMTACGVPEDAAPREVTGQLPDALLEADPPSSTQPPASEVVTIYLVRRTDEELTLEAVPREVDAADPSTAAINAVLSPATPAESRAGLSTLFGEGTALVETLADGDVLDVRLDSLAGFPADPNSTDFQVAVAMLVCTATTSFDDVAEVLVSIAQEDGTFRPIAIRLPGDVVQPDEGEPVTCEQFSSFFPG
jgi:spore germination protein GerM